MHQNGLIPENAEEYFQTSTHHPTGITSYHPVSAIFMSQVKDIKGSFKKTGLHCTKVFGWPGRNASEKRMAQQFQAANYLVLPEHGDCHSIAQFLKFVYENGPIAAQNRKPKVVVIENTKGQYTPVLEAIFGPVPKGWKTADYYKECLTSAANGDQSPPFVQFHFSAGRSDSVEICKNAKTEIRKHQAAFFDTPLPRKEKKVLANPVLVASTSDRKLLEAETCFSEVGIQTKPLRLLTGVYKEALEKHGTYEGNANGIDDTENNSGKAYTIIHHLREMMNDREKKKQLIKDAKSMGLDPNQPIPIYVDDRGLEVPAEIIDYFNFENAHGIHRSDFKPVPGVELTYYLQAMGGMEGFFHEVNQAFDRYEQAYLVGAETKKVSREITERCVSTLIQFDLKTGKATLDSTTASKTCRLSDVPKTDSTLFESEAWLIPKENNPEGKTGGQMPFHYYMTHHEKALKAMRALIQATGLQAKDTKNLRPYTGEYQVGLIGKEQDHTKLGLPENGYYAPASQPLPEKLRMAMSSRLGKAGNNGNDYSVTTSTLGDGEKVFAGRDAVMFTNMEGLPQSDLADRGYLLFSAVVAKQLNPEDSEKLLGIDRRDPKLKNLCEQLERLFSYGYMGNFPPRLFHNIGGSESPSDLVATHKKHYRRTPASPVEHPDQYVDIKAKLGTDGPMMFICCSATSPADRDREDVKRLVHSAARQGIDISYGGGDKFMMGEVLRQGMIWNLAIALNQELLEIENTSDTGKITEIFDIVQNLNLPVEEKNVSIQIATIQKIAESFGMAGGQEIEAIERIAQDKEIPEDEKVARVLDVVINKDAENRDFSLTQKVSAINAIAEALDIREIQEIAGNPSQSEKLAELQALDEINVIGVSTPSVLKRETLHGEQPEGLAYAHVSGTIYGRMATLFGNSDTARVLSGGAGTVQELLAFAKLKEEDRKRTPGEPLPEGQFDVQGKSLWIANNEILPGKPRLYDPILEFFGNGDREVGIRYLESLDIHVADNVDEVIEQTRSR